jgi:IPT/TIG domain-containing protein
MAAPARVPLGADQLARDWYVDVNIGSFATPNWIPVNGWQDLKPTFNPTTQDSSDYDSAGYKDSAVTAIEWGVTGKLGRKTRASDPTQYDQGQEVLRLAAQQLGNGNRVDIRFYEAAGGIGGSGSNPRAEAYRGFTNVQWEPDGGGMEALNVVSVTLGGKGQRSSITHPEDGNTPAPVITSIAPNSGIAAAGGALLIANGTNFATVSAITIGGTTVNTTDWEYANGAIALKAVAKAAGSYPVVMTNPGGTSNSYTITYV